jgi:signal transduction histidine kinase/DNA-binding response OmpR family regulator
MEQSATFVPKSAPTSTWPSELEAFLSQLQRETILLALSGLLVGSAVFLSTTGWFRETGRGTWSALAFVVLALIVWGLRYWSYLAAALVLVAGCLAVILLLTTWGNLQLAVFLMIVPVGLATLAISRAAGVVTAAVCTGLLLFAPSTLLPDDPTLRIITSLGIWSTVGMIWLTLRPLLTAVAWVWTGYERSQTLLRQTRDYQLQLHQTLEDLEAANVQLTRLNQQARALRQVAEEERRAKERFVANVSHELRTPLNMIIGFCEMITQAPETYGRDVPPALLADLAVVLRNSQHLSSLIDDVLDLSQIEAGQMPLTKELVSLAEVVQAAAIAVRPLFESKGLYLDTENIDDLPQVLCDRTRIHEVVLNLLSNAGRFTERGGVRVQAWREGDDVVVSVADTGPGIAEEDQERLFQPFQQLEDPVRRRYGGTGLGLSISKRFVELHQGQMWLESEPGEGATFFFRLPIAPPMPIEGGASARLIPGWEYLQRTRPSRAPVADVRPRMVVVEKGDAMQRLISRYLDGIEVVTVADLEEAFEELSRVPAQALLINEVRVAEALELVNGSVALPHGTPAMICSIPDIGQAADAIGGSDYLVKPVSRETLLGALDRLEEKVETVLVVDDEPDALRLFGRILAEAGRGYRVMRASNGRRALEILCREQLDAVLLDLMMPEMDGFQVLAVMSEDATMWDIPVILVSARDPFAQPIVSNALSVTCRDGLSVQQLLACIKSLSAILSTASRSGDPAQTTMLPG